MDRCIIVYEDLDDSASLAVVCDSKATADRLCDGLKWDNGEVKQPWANSIAVLYDEGHGADGMSKVLDGGTKMKKKWAALMAGADDKSVFTAADMDALSGTLEHVAKLVDEGAYTFDAVLDEMDNNEQLALLAAQKRVKEVVILLSDY